MFGNQNQPIVPRNGHTLVVGIVARISGCQDQREVSLDDQVDHGKQLVTDMYEGAVDYRCIETKGKGERLDRPELAEIEAMLRSDELDLLIFEDLGRVVRGAAAMRLLGIGVDHGVRCISPNDCLDTAEATWEEDALSACRDHVGHNAHTSKRIKHKMLNRFVKFGACTARPPYGYIIPPEAKTYYDWQKNSTGTPIIQKGAQIILATGNCSMVADYFNQEKVPVRKHKRSRNNWNGKKIRQFYRLTILKGMPGRGFKYTVKHHETGRRMAVINPKGPVFRDCPHLAHLDPGLFDQLNDLLDKKNKKLGRKAINGADPLARLPRKRSRFPGHCATCWYCGRTYVWGGNGMPGHLMCSGAREWHCWNSIGFDGKLAAEQIVTALTGWLEELPGFEDQFAQLVQAAQEDMTGGLTERWSKLKLEEDDLAREKQNVMDSIVSFGARPMLKAKLDELEATERELKRQRYELTQIEATSLKLPVSSGPLRDKLLAELGKLATSSYEMGDLLRQIVVEFRVYLVRLLDGGHPLPRAKVVLDLTGCIAGISQVPGLGNLLRRELTLDLFEKPQRETIREAAAKLAAEGNLTQAQIAAMLPGKPTKTAVGHALALDARMRAEGRTSPYIVLEGPPADYAKLRRHRNDKYQFVPVDGDERPPL